MPCCGENSGYISDLCNWKGPSCFLAEVLDIKSLIILVSPTMPLAFIKSLSFFSVLYAAAAVVRD